MTAANSYSNSASVRFTSIEPFAPFVDKVREIADRHGCKTEFQAEMVVNAPFCGFNYHVQEVNLTFQGPVDSISDSRTNCFREFSTIEETFLADGYFEVIG